MPYALCLALLAAVSQAALSAVPQSAHSAVVDNTIDCDGVPYWDRFIVNDKDTKWDPNKGCSGRARSSDADSRGLYGSGNGQDLSEYGVPATRNSSPANGLYGYNHGVNPTVGSQGAARVAAAGASSVGIYGVAHKVRQDSENRNLYGYYHGANPGAKVEESTAAAKPAVADVKKKAAPIKKASAKKIVKKKPAPAVAAAPKPAKIAAACPPETAAPVKSAAPSDESGKIAYAAKKPGIEDFCTQFNPPVKGKLPKGLILMRGAPQSMSCVKNP
jgi:hypothetical protein